MGNKFNKLIPNKYAHLNPNDVVFTPDLIAKQIVDMFKPSGKILEPCKGEGVFLKYLPPDTDWCEIAEGRDFYDYKDKIDWIVTNPPYSDFNRFLNHCFELAQNVVLLVPLAKVFKSMGTIKEIRQFGWIKKCWLLPASKCGFPFGFPCGCFHFERGYRDKTEWIVYGEDDGQLIL